MPEPTKINGTTIVGISTVEIPELDSRKKKLSLTKPLPDQNLKDSSAPKMSVKEKVRVAAAEMIGTGILVFVGCMGCVDTITFVPTLQLISLTFGFAVMIVITIFGHVSGAHLNPAVTVAALILGQFKEIVLVPIYIASQVIGAVGGFGLLRIVTPTQYFEPPVTFDPITNETIRAPGICTTVPSHKISSIQALVVEIIITLILILVCAGVWDVRNKNKHDSVPIKFGLTIAALAMAGGSYTGASMNPARSFGPALINWHWQQHWVYWIGPLLAGVVGAGIYKLVFSPANDTTEETPEGIPLTTRKG